MSIHGMECPPDGSWISEGANMFPDYGAHWGNGPYPIDGWSYSTNLDGINLPPYDHATGFGPHPGPGPAPHPGPFGGEIPHVYQSVDAGAAAGAPVHGVTATTHSAAIDAVSSTPAVGGIEGASVTTPGVACPPPPGPNWMDVMPDYGHGPGQFNYSANLEGIDLPPYDHATGLIPSPGGFGPETMTPVTGAEGAATVTAPTASVGLGAAEAAPAVLEAGGMTAAAGAPVAQMIAVDASAALLPDLLVGSIGGVMDPTGLAAGVNLASISAVTGAEMAAVTATTGAVSAVSAAPAIIPAATVPTVVAGTGASAETLVAV